MKMKDESGIVPILKNLTVLWKTSTLKNYNGCVKCNHRSTAMQKKKKMQYVSAITGYTKEVERKDI